MQKKNIATICLTFQNLNPEPKTELSYTNEYTLLIAIILSAQSTDVGVNKATSLLFNQISTPQEIVALGLEELKTYIKTIGLYNSKAKNIIKTSETLIQDYGGNIPNNRDDLMKLPGVGRKTANVFLNCAFGHLTIGVDTHVQRVSNRIGIVSSDNVLETELQLDKKIPKKFKQNIHHWLILHGRYICKARTPLCDQCQIAQLCQYSNKNLS